MLDLNDYNHMPGFASFAQLIEIIDGIPANLAETALSEGLSKKTIGIQTDTRLLQPGAVFLAFRGERFDGHQFVSTAIAKGALAAIVDFDYPNDELPVLRVRNTLEAYQKIGRWWREQFNIPVIGVTGSVGKTTTKEIIAAVLGTQGRVHKTFANFNNEIGVPKTLMEITDEHNFAVIEMAMRGRGQIAELAEIARPTIGVITNVGTAHIELLGSEEAIAEAKCELLASMPLSSVAVLNHDNPLLLETARKVWQGKTITYGFSPEGEKPGIQGKMIDNSTLEVGGMRFELPMPGRHIAANFMAALAVARELGIDWASLESGVVVDMPGGRSQRYALDNDVVLLDETYNAAPEAMLASLQLLADTPGTRRIAVLGAMKELGEHSHQLHQRVGKTVQKLNLDALLVLVDGEDAKAIAQSAEGVPYECFKSHADLTERLKGFMKSGDRILFKAAHSVGLDKVVSQLREK